MRLVADHEKIYMSFEPAGDGPDRLASTPNFLRSDAAEADPFRLEMDMNNPS